LEELMIKHKNKKKRKNLKENNKKQDRFKTYIKNILDYENNTNILLITFYYIKEKIKKYI